MLVKEERALFSKLGQNLTEPVVTQLMTKALEHPDVLSLAVGFTDNARMPKEIIYRAVDAVLSQEGDAEYLQYGMNQGRPGLRAATADFLKQYPNEKADLWKPENFIISNGSQQALYLAMQVLCDPGDYVFVEGPSYFVFLELLNGLGINPITLRCLTDGGIDFDALRQQLDKIRKEGNLNRIKAFYLMGYFGNPSCRCISWEDKRALGRLIKEYKLDSAVLEDSAYRELYFNEPYPVPSILSVEEMADIPRLYLGTYTKPFSCGMKIGYGCCSDREWLQKMLYVKGHHDFGSANFSQAIIEKVITNNWSSKWLNDIHAWYGRKADVLQETLENEQLSTIGWSWKKPEGGLMAWLKGPEGLDTSLESAFCKACLGNNVLYVPGDLCFAERSPRNYVRISFGSLDEDRLKMGIKRFSEVAKRFSK